MTKNKKILTLIIGLLIIICLTLGTLGLTYNKKDITKTIKENEIDDETDKEVEESEESDNYIYLYEESSGWWSKDSIDKYHQNSVNKIIYKIKVESPDAKILDFIYENYILYDDNGLKLINTVTNQKENINLESTYDSYQLIKNDEVDKTVEEKDSDIIAIGFYQLLDEKTKIYGYYDLKTSKTFADKTTQYGALDEEYIQSHKVNSNESCIIRIIDSKKIYCKVAEDSSIEDDKLSTAITFKKIEGNNKLFVATMVRQEYGYTYESINAEVINEEGKIIFKDLYSTILLYGYVNNCIDIHNDKIYAIENGNIVISDFKGNIEKSIPVEINTKGVFIVKNTMIIEKDNNIYAIDIDEEEETLLYTLKDNESIIGHFPPEYSLGSTYSDTSLYVILEGAYDKPGIYITIIKGEELKNEIFYDIVTKEVKIFELTYNENI